MSGLTIGRGMELAMKASIDGAVVAEAQDSELISTEGNYYFPRAFVLQPRGQGRHGLVAFDKQQVTVG